MPIKTFLILPLKFYSGVPMKTKVKDLTVSELQTLISDTVKTAMEELIEDMLALSSEEYLDSIKEARKDYEEGRIKQFEEVFDV